MSQNARLLRLARSRRPRIVAAMKQRAHQEQIEAEAHQIFRVVVSIEREINRMGGPRLSSVIPLTWRLRSFLRRPAGRAS